MAMHRPALAIEIGFDDVGIGFSSLDNPTTYQVPKHTIDRSVVAAAIAATITASACLPIPHWHTVRPAAHIQVSDQSGRPIGDARISAYAGSIIGGTMRRTTTIRTDSAGRARVARHRRWHLVMFFLPDAEAPSAFGWCAAAPGYAARGPLPQAAHDGRLDIPLVPDPRSESCPGQLQQGALREGRLAPPPTNR